MRSLLRPRSGFTILEMVITALIASVVIGLTGMLLMGGIRNKRAMDGRSGLLSAGAQVDELLRRDLERAGQRMFATYNISGVNIKTSGPDSLANDTLTILAARGRALSNSTKTCSVLGTASSTDCMVLFGDARSDLKVGSLVLTGNPQTGGKILLITQVSDTVSLPCGTDCAQERVLVSKTVTGAVMDSVVVGHKITYDNGDVYHLSGACPAPEPSPNYTCENKWEYVQVGDDVSISTVADNGQNKPYTEVKFVDLTSAFGYPQASTWTFRSGAFGVPAVKTQEIRFTRYYLDRRQNQHPMLVKQSNLLPEGTFAVAEPVAYDVKSFLVQTQHRGQTGLARGVQLSAADLVVDESNPNFVSTSVAGEGESVKSYDFLKSYTTIASVRARYVVQDRRTATHDVAARVRKEIPMAVLVATNHLLDGGVFDPRMTETGYVEPTTTSANGWNSPPIAHMKADKVSISKGESVIFTDGGSTDPDGSIVSWALSPGDGAAPYTGTGNFSSATHTYTTVGTYSAVLTVTDNQGATGTYTIQIEVLPVNVAPVSRIVAPTNPVTGVWLTFDGSTSTDDDGEIVKYEWTFSDGQTASGKAATVMFHVAGSYSVDLKVTDDRGASTTATKGFTVGTGNSAPTAVISAPSCVSSPGYCQEGVEYTWDASSSTDSDGTLERFVWEFGDGSPRQEGPVVTHKFIKGGNLTVSLTVFDNDGASSGASLAVAVNKAPNAKITPPECALTSTGCYAGVAYWFLGDGSSDADGSITGYTWTSNGSAIATSSNTNYTFPSAGTYTMQLSVVDNQGGVGASSLEVTVHPDQRPTVICADETVPAGQSSTITCSVKNNTASSLTYTFATNSLDETIVSVAEPTPSSSPIGGGQTVNVTFPVSTTLKGGSAKVRLSATNGSQVGIGEATITTSENYSILLSDSTNYSKGYQYTLSSWGMDQPYPAFLGLTWGTEAHLVLGRGFNVVQVDKATKSVDTKRSFDTYGSAAEADNMASFLNAVPAGKLVFIFSSDAWESSVTETLRQAFYARGLGGIRQTHTVTGNADHFRQPYSVFIDTDAPMNNVERLEGRYSASYADIRGGTADGSIYGSTWLSLSQHGRLAVKVTNKSTQPGEISLTATCSGQVSNCTLTDALGTVITKTRSLKPDSSQLVLINYKAAEAAGSGQVRLDASFNTASASLTRSVNVVANTTIQTPAVIIGPGDFDVLAKATGTRTIEIKNLHNKARTFSIAPYTSNADVISLTAPATVTLEPFQSKPISLSYTIGNVADAATATYGADVTVSSLLTSARGTVTVATTLAAPTVRPDVKNLVIEPNQNGIAYFWVRNESNVNRVYSLGTSVSGVFDTASPDVPSVTLAPFDSVKVGVSYKVIRYAEEGSTGEITLNAFDSNFLGTGTAYATTRLVLSNPVVVAPADFSALPGQVDTAYFSLRNSTNARRTFTLAAEKLGQVVSVGSAATITLDAFKSTSVAIAWKLSDTAPYLSTGTIKLSATDSISSGWDDVVITTAAVEDVPIVESTGDFEAAENQTGTQAFWVTNNSNMNKAITLVASNSGVISGVAVEGSNPLSFTPFERKQVLVKWTTAIDALGGETGLVILKAADGSLVGSDTSTATIKIRYGVHINDLVDQVFKVGHPTTLTYSVTNTGNSKRWFAFEDLWGATPLSVTDTDDGVLDTWSCGTHEAGGWCAVGPKDPYHGYSVLRMNKKGGAGSYERVPFDRNTLYRIEGWARQAQDGANGTADQRLYIGVQALDANGSNISQCGTYSYVAATYYPLQQSQGWVKFAGYIKGDGASSHACPANDPNNPSALIGTVAQISPLVLVNYFDSNANAGLDRITELAGLRIVPVSTTDPNGLEVRHLTPAPVEIGPNTTMSVSLGGIVDSGVSASQVMGRLRVYDQALPQYADTGTVTGTVQESLKNPSVIAPADSLLKPERSGTARYTVVNNSNVQRTFNLSVSRTGDLTSASVNAQVTIAALSSAPVDVSWAIGKSVRGTKSQITLSAVDGEYTGSATWTLTTDLLEKTPTASWSSSSLGVDPGQGYINVLTAVNETNEARTLCLPYYTSNGNVASSNVFSPDAIANSPGCVSYVAYESKTFNSPGAYFTVSSQAEAGWYANGYADVYDQSNTALRIQPVFRATVNLVELAPVVTWVSPASGSYLTPENWHTITYTVKNATNAPRTLRVTNASSNTVPFSDPADNGDLSFAAYEEKTLTSSAYAYWREYGESSTLSATALNLTSSQSHSASAALYIALVDKYPGYQWMTGNQAGVNGQSMTAVLRLTNNSNTTREICGDPYGNDGNVTWPNVIASDPATVCAVLGWGGAYADLNVPYTIPSTAQYGWYAYITSGAWINGVGFGTPGGASFQVYVNLNDQTPSISFQNATVYGNPGQTVGNTVYLTNNSNTPRDICTQFGQTNGNVGYWDQMATGASEACFSLGAFASTNYVSNHTWNANAHAGWYVHPHLRAFISGIGLHTNYMPWRAETNLVDKTPSISWYSTSHVVDVGTTYTNYLNYTNNSNTTRSICPETSGANGNVTWTSVLSAAPGNPGCVSLGAFSSTGWLASSYTVRSDASDGWYAYALARAYIYGVGYYSGWQYAYVEANVPYVAPQVTAPSSTTVIGGNSATIYFSVYNPNPVARTYNFVATSGNTGVFLDPADPTSVSIPAGTSASIPVTITAHDNVSDGQSATISLQAIDAGSTALNHTAGNTMYTQAAFYVSDWEGATYVISNWYTEPFRVHNRSSKERTVEVVAVGNLNGVIDGHYTSPGSQFTIAAGGYADVTYHYHLSGTLGSANMWMHMRDPATTTGIANSSAVNFTMGQRRAPTITPDFSTADHVFRRFNTWTTLSFTVTNNSDGPENFEYSYSGSDYQVQNLNEVTGDCNDVPAGGTCKVYHKWYGTKSGKSNAATAVRPASSGLGWSNANWIADVSSFEIRSFDARTITAAGSGYEDIQIYNADPNNSYVIDPGTYQLSGDKWNSGTWLTDENPFTICAGCAVNTRIHWNDAYDNFQGTATQLVYVVLDVNGSAHGETHQSGGYTDQTRTFTINTTAGGTGLAVSWYNTSDAGESLRSVSGRLLESKVFATADFVNYDPAGDTDTYAMRAAGQIYFPTDGSYSICTESDDGVRMWLNGSVIIDNWTDHAPTMDCHAAFYSGGTWRDIVIEHYEANGGQVLRLFWTPPSGTQHIIPQSYLRPQGTGLVANWYNDTSTGCHLCGPLALIEPTPRDRIYWVDRNPLTIADTYSLRMEGFVYAPVSGTYTFCTTADDGQRLWVNGSQLYDDWTLHAPQEVCGNIGLSAGSWYPIKVEHYENLGGQHLELNWTVPGQSKTYIPRKYLNGTNLNASVAYGFGVENSRTAPLKSLSAPTLTCSRSVVLAGDAFHCNTSASVGEAVSLHHYDFGDGSSESVAGASTASAEHVYLEPGEYVVSTYLTSHNGETSTYRATSITVHEDRAPDVPSAVVLCPGDDCVGDEPVSLAITATDPDVAMGDSVLSVYLDLGNGRALWAAPGDTLSIDLPSAGVYTMKLTAYDRLGLGSAAGYVSVNVRERKEPDLRCWVLGEPKLGNPFDVVAEFSTEVPIRSVEISSPSVTEKQNMTLDDVLHGRVRSQYILEVLGEHAFTCSITDDQGQVHRAKVRVEVSP